MKKMNMNINKKTKEDNENDEDDDGDVRMISKEQMQETKTNKVLRIGLERRIKAKKRKNKKDHGSSKPPRMIQNKDFTERNEMVVEEMETDQEVGIEDDGRSNNYTLGINDKYDMNKDNLNDIMMMGPPKVPKKVPMRMKKIQGMNVNKTKVDNDDEDKRIKVKKDPSTGVSINKAVKTVKPISNMKDKLPGRSRNTSKHNQGRDKDIPDTK